MGMKVSIRRSVEVGNPCIPADVSRYDHHLSRMTAVQWIDPVERGPGKNAIMRAITEDAAGMKRESLALQSGGPMTGTGEGILTGTCGTQVMTLSM